MPEEMVEFEEAPSGEEEFVTYEVFDVGTKTDSWYQEATLYSDEDFYVQGFLLHLELAVESPSGYWSWTYDVVLGSTLLARIYTRYVDMAMNFDTYYVIDENYNFGASAAYYPGQTAGTVELLLNTKPRIYSGGYANEFNVTATYGGTPPVTKDQYAFGFSVISSRKQYDITKNLYY
ncbi:MAG: hypothetical protein SVM80_10760 [Halobacteriota archaeon]|nr:hypothetical protein [Halobacteriota archaeon]